ncbi:unnamed protein product [Rotaria sp. Silwood1]|nr:unnamed protein product [Rotaria sp. Silwood1]CAF4851775.1 unnamed protein product [Rotaria sp. Silwood1]
MALNRKNSFIDSFLSSNPNHDQESTLEQRSRRATIISANPLMNIIKPFFNGNKNDEVPEFRNRVRYIRDSCKVLSDIWKTDKDFLNKNLDSDILKAFKEFRSSDVAQLYHYSDGQYGSPSILNSTIDDLIEIHEFIDTRRKEWFENFRKITEQAKEKQLSIRQTMSELRDNYERAQRKFETAEANFKKFRTRSDRVTIPNYDERYQELEEIYIECDQIRISNRDIYFTETNRIASEEYLISCQFFAKYLTEEQIFYNDIHLYLFNRIPQIKYRLDNYKLAPSFHCDLSEHCLKRIHRPIAYPIEMSLYLLENSIEEEGLFRIAPQQVKQKKFVTELDLQIINKNIKLRDLTYDPHVPAATLKQYLRELPDCLLTDALLPQWNQIILLSSDEDRIRHISQLINKLPRVNYDNLCYLIRFLSRVAEYSSVNKMTASNLGICIGCSLLYPKEQTSNLSMSNSYTISSIIVELMIIYNKQLFPLNNQIDIEQDNQTLYQSQPDLIPTFIQSKSYTGSNENLVDTQSITGLSQSSPKISHKKRAPHAPFDRQMPVQIESTYNRQNNIEDISKDNIHLEQIIVSRSPTSNNKSSHRHGSVEYLLDNPNGLPIFSQYRSKVSNNIKEQDISQSKEDDKITSKEILLVNSTSNDDIHFTKLNSNRNNRMANSNIDSGQTTNTNAVSSCHDNKSSPLEEITQF